MNSLLIGRKVEFVYRREKCVGTILHIGMENGLFHFLIAPEDSTYLLTVHGSSAIRLVTLDDAVESAYRQAAGG